MELTAAEVQQQAAAFQATGQPARVFKEFPYPTRQGWWRARRVIAKAEHLAKGANPRVTLAPKRGARELYEDLDGAAALEPDPGSSPARTKWNPASRCTGRHLHNRDDAFPIGALRRNSIYP